MRSLRGWIVPIAIIVLAVLGGVLVGALFARHEMFASHRGRFVATAPGEFEPASPRIVGEPSTPVPVPSATAAIAIGFLDERTKSVIEAPVVRTKVGTCVVAQLRPAHASPYRRLVGGEHWAIGGAPEMQVRAGDAPGYCLTWQQPSGRKGFPIDANAVVADQAGRDALGVGSARVVVVGTPKPQSGSSSKVIRKGRPRPKPGPQPNDQ